MVRREADSDVLSLLSKSSPQRLADILHDERPQVIAVLLTRFPSRLASETLARLPTAVQLDVIRRLKSLGEVPDDLVHEIARTVHDRLQVIAPAAGRATKAVPVAERNEAFTPANRVTHALKAPPKPRAFA